MGDVFLSLLPDLARSHRNFRRLSNAGEKEESDGKGWGRWSEDYAKFRHKYGEKYLKDQLFIAWCWLANGEWALRHDENDLFENLCAGKKPQKKYIKEIVDMAYGMYFDTGKETSK
jgi:hypothetical protein